jgi:predicted SprT family Zn-dependent metalloprotease
MNVTSRDVQAAYDFLCRLAPFNKWGLPDARKVKFSISRVPDEIGACHISNEFSISLNDDMHLTLVQLLETVAHEMIHVKQQMLGKLPDDPSKHHNATYRRMRKQVCLQFGFDVQRF